MSEAMIGVAFFSIFMVWIVAHYSARCFKAWQTTALKRDMVARGYTAQEILDVVAGASEGGGLGQVGREMAVQGYTAEDIRDVLAGMQTAAGSKHVGSVPPAKPIKQPAYSP